MADRYSGYGRPRSPVYNEQRASLPLLVGGYSTTPSYEHSHAVPIYRREHRPSHSTTFPAGPPGSIITTYKIKPELLQPELPTRSTSRARSATMESRAIPTIVTAAPRLRPVVHRPLSPAIRSPRASEEEYYDYAVPAGTQTARRRSSIDPSVGREDRYIASRPRSTYPSTIARHADNLRDDYGADGYGYTNPRDLVAYDLMNNDTESRRRRSRRDSFDGSRSSRPLSITNMADIQSPRTYEPRERGPPPSTRGFDRIPPSWDPPLRTSTQTVSAVDPGQRSGGMLEPEVRLRRSGSRSSRRPVSMYNDFNDPRDVRRPRDEYARDDYYDPRDDDLREKDRRSRETRSKAEKFDDEKPYRMERADREREKQDRAERSDRPERQGRVERPERRERSVGHERIDRDEREKHDERSEKTRDKIRTGLSIASAALGLGAIGASGKDDREEDSKKKDHHEDHRRHHDRESSDPTGRDNRETKDRRHRARDDEREDRKSRNKDEDREERRNRDRDSDREERRHHEKDEEREERLYLEEREPRDREERRYDPPRSPVREIEYRKSDRDDDLLPHEVREQRHSPDNHLPRRHRDSDVPARTSPDYVPSRRREEEVLATHERHSPDVVSARDSKEKTDIREERDEDRKARSDVATVGARTMASDDEDRANTRKHPLSNAPFNPNDTMDLMALKAALANKDPSPPPEPVSAGRSRESATKDSREVAEIRNELDRGRRSPLSPNANNQLRVVSPPREKPEEKPVKGILRQPRDKFPEYPAVREGVAPLKDAKKDGVPPDARWTKIARKLVNPEALEIGKERYEARDDFVIVLRVLSREEIQSYAIATQQLRAKREEDARRRARRERHERHKRERARGTRRYSESSGSDDDWVRDKERDRPKMLEGPMMSGGLGES